MILGLPRPVKKRKNQKTIQGNGFVEIWKNHLSYQVESQNNKIKAHDQALFDTEGIILKHEWQILHRVSNLRLIESLHIWVKKCPHYYQEFNKQLES